MLHTLEIIEDQFTNSILDVLRNLLLQSSDTCYFQENLLLLNFRMRNL